MELLEFNFFIEPPIDFEFKKYKVLSYTSETDKRYVESEFNPWLLNNKLLLLDLNNFINNLEDTRKLLTKRVFKTYGKTTIYQEELPRKIESLDKIEDIIIYSIPIIKRSNDFGIDLSSSAGIILW